MHVLKRWSSNTQDCLTECSVTGVCMVMVTAWWRLFVLRLKQLEADKMKQTSDSNFMETHKPLNTDMDSSIDEHISRLVEERDTLLRTGVYTTQDKIIVELDRQIREAIAQRNRWFRREEVWSEGCFLVEEELQWWTTAVMKKNYSDDKKLLSCFLWLGSEALVQVVRGGHSSWRILCSVQRSVTGIQSSEF